MQFILVSIFHSVRCLWEYAGVSVRHPNRLRPFDLAEAFPRALAARDPRCGGTGMQDRLLDPLATKLLLGESKPGDRIKVAARDGALNLRACEGPCSSTQAPFIGARK